MTNMDNDAGASFNLELCRAREQSTTKPGAFDRACRAAIHKALETLGEGVLTLVDAHAPGEPPKVFGRATQAFGARATIRVERPRFYRRALFGGSVGAAEAYMDGDWTTDDLTAVIRVAARNAALKTGMDRGLGALGKMKNALVHLLRPNTRAGSRRNIAAHYDLSNEFFGLFLDETMMYSSAYFDRPEMSLRDASIAKIDLACRRLQLGPDDHLLEIGTGWGAFAIHAAREYGCRVTTTTISREQRALAEARVRDAGLEHRITLLAEDYRDLRGQYDKLVSIEMIEAVGHQFLETYLRRVGELIKPQGMALLQAITIPDQHFERAVREADFIKRHIFPGGFLPSIAAICDGVRKRTDMRLVHLHDFGPHYARTLRHWRERMFANLDGVRALGMDDRFIRMWEYYLSYCEGAFEERSIGVSQMLFARPLCRRDAFVPA